MGVSVDKGHFKTRDDAVAEITGNSLVPSDRAIPVGDIEDVHWHETGLVLYVLTGACETKDAATGDILLAEPGDRITIPARTLHAARCPQPATFVVGFESEQAITDFRPNPPEALAQEPTP